MINGLSKKTKGKGFYLLAIYKMKIQVICPLYNAEKYIVELHKSILRQDKITEIKIKYILTESQDNTEYLLDKLGVDYDKISKQEFNHSLTREKAAFQSKADVIVFITQDIKILNNEWLYNLVIGIYEKRYAAAYSRQICLNKSIEHYTREKNYPPISHIISKKDIEKLGLRTFFFSDASSAIDLNIFKKLNGYDGKKLPISEDMYFAHKLIHSGYSIGYCANSIVDHSHDFTLKELYDRYYLTGVFFKENAYLDQYNTTDSGLSLAIYILTGAIKDMNIKVLFSFVPNMIVRYFGLRNGKKQ